MTEMEKNVRASPPDDGNDLPAGPSLFMEIMFLFAKIVVIIVVFLLVFTFIFGLYRNTDASMSPAFKDGDLVMFYRLDKNYLAQDTLVVEFEGERQVRRVIAVSGDTVDITEDGLLVNGAIQQEKEIYTITQRYERGVEFPLTVGMGEVFVLGDSRADATDSRIYGSVKIKDTLGKIMLILRWRNT